MEGFSFIIDTHYRYLKTKSILAKYFGKIVGKKAQRRKSKKKKKKSQNRCYKKTKHTKFSEKRTLLTLWNANIGSHIRRRNVRFSEIWCALFFYNTHFEILPYNRRKLLNYSFWTCYMIQSTSCVQEDDVLRVRKKKFLNKANEKKNEKKNEEK